MMRDQTDDKLSAFSEVQRHPDHFTAQNAKVPLSDVRVL